jgi:hypothetical protein
VSQAQVSLTDLSTRGAEPVQRGASPLSDVAAWASNEAKARYEVTARVLRLHPLPKPVAIDLESARWFTFLETLEVRVATGSVSSAQRSRLLSILDRARARQPSLRRPAVGVSSDGLLNASWSFIDMPGRVFSLEIQHDGAVDWFYRDAATNTSRGSEDELRHELPEEALLLLAAGFSMDPAGSR